MVDQLQAAQQWLSQMLKRHVSRTVTYQQGSSLIEVSATVGRTLLKVDDGNGGTEVVWTDRDYLIAADDLKVGDQPILPRHGDRIVDGSETPMTEYEVLNYGGESVYRPSDPYAIMLRIHTKRIGGT